MTYILGVDGGNSKTIAAVADTSGRVVGIGRAGCANHQAHGLTSATEQVQRAVEAALAMAQLRPDQVNVAYYALAGADLDEDFALLRPAVAAISPVGYVDLGNDSAASLRAGSGAPNAVVVAWGAGVVGAGRNAAGQEIRLPALGWFSGDWGGGEDLGQAAIWYSVRAHDGRGEPSMLGEMVLSALDLPSIDELVRAVYVGHVTRYDIIRLARLVFEAAAAGDAVARQLVQRSGDEVAVTATSLLRRLDIATVPADVVLGGSIFRAPGALLLDTIRHRLHQMVPLAHMVVLDTDPVTGAVLRALDAAGISVDQRMERTVRETYEAFISPTGSVQQESGRR